MYVSRNSHLLFGHLSELPFNYDHLPDWDVFVLRCFAELSSFSKFELIFRSVELKS